MSDACASKSQGGNPRTSERKAGATPPALSDYLLGVDRSAVNYNARRPAYFRRSVGTASSRRIDGAPARHGWGAGN